MYKHKNLQIVILLSQILKKHNCTYNEVEEIISILSEEIRLQRECKEYKTAIDWANGNKSHIADNDIIDSLNFVKPYLPEIE